MANRYALEKPAKRQKLIGLLAEGQTLASAAEAMSVGALSVTFQAVWEFSQRHKSEIEAWRDRLTRAAEDYDIAQKRERIKAMQRRWESMESVITGRQEAYKDSDFAPARTGIVVHEYKETKMGVLRDQWKLDTGLLAEFRALERAAAEELGQIERPSINQNIQVNQFLVREYGLDNPTET